MIRMLPINEKAGLIRMKTIKSYMDNTKADIIKKQIGMDIKINVTLVQEIKDQNNGKFCSVQSLLNRT